MKAIYGFWLVVLLSPLVLAGCKKDGKGGGSDQGEADYPIKGKVLKVMPDQKKVRLDHEDIPGLMEAMQMDFAVADTKLLRGLKPGDQVEGRLKVEDGKYVITELKKR
jgi:protein SCO1/2